MKKLSEELEKRISDYLDGKMDPSQQSAFEQSMLSDAELKRYFEEIRIADELLRQSLVEQPSKNFTSTVMRKLDQYPATSGLSIRNGIILLCGILTVMVTAVILLSSGVFDQTTTLDLNSLQLANRYLKQSLPQLSLNLKTIMNVILLVNLVLAFIVLDRAILKPIFNRRLETGP
jgi:hypothetical protein